MKKIISALLSLCIAGGVMPAIPQYAPESVITANSADEVKTDLEGNKYYEVVDGDLLYWLYSDHALVRSNYEGSAVGEYIIKTSGDIVIPSEFRGVPVTGVFGFGGAQELTSITLPDTITIIADNAILNCTSLETINVPKSVNRVGYDAFEGTLCIENKRKESPLVILNGLLVDGHKCEGEVVIPDNVTRIADRAFMDCQSIESVSIPDSVEYIGRQAFYNTGWLNKLSAENELVIVNGFLLNGNNCGEKLVIPDTVKSINGQSFAGVDTLQSVTIPKSVKHIGLAAFYMCPELESVTILSPDCEIESYIAFSNGRREESGDVYFDGTIYGYDGSTAQAYAEKYGYKFEVIYDDKIKTDVEGNKYREVEDGDLLYWVYPDHAVVRSNYEVLPNSEMIVKASGDVVIPSEINGVPVTGVFGFGGAQELTSITLPDTVTQIAANTFNNCRSLETINIPESVTFIGAEAFGETPWIENKRNDSHLVIVNDILVECYNSEGEVIIPDNIRSIADYAFLSSENVDSVSIPDSVEYIGREAFRGTRFLDSITDENGFAIANGFLIDGKKCKGDVAIPDTVRIISGEAFTLSKLTSVTIPESVTTIGDYAFYNCPKLRSITILNPNCELKGISAFDSAYDSEGTSYRGTVYGYGGSTAQTYAEKYGYKFEPVPGYSTLKGDANLDGRVNIADAVLVMQVATNPDKYAQGKSEFSISAQGEINADVDGKKGLSNSDALLIQKFKLGLIDKF